MDNIMDLNGFPNQKPYPEYRYPDKDGHYKDRNIIPNYGDTMNCNTLVNHKEFSHVYVAKLIRPLGHGKRIIDRDNPKRAYKWVNYDQWLWLNTDGGVITIPFQAACDDLTVTEKLRIAKIEHERMGMVATVDPERSEITFSCACGERTAKLFNTHPGAYIKAKVGSVPAPVYAKTYTNYKTLQHIG